MITITDDFIKAIKDKERKGIFLCQGMDRREFLDFLELIMKSSTEYVAFGTESTNDILLDFIDLKDAT